MLNEIINKLEKDYPFLVTFEKYSLLKSQANDLNKRGSLITSILLLIVANSFDKLTDQERQYLVYSPELNLNYSNQDGRTVLMVVAEKYNDQKKLIFTDEEINHLLKKSNLYRRINSYFNRYNVFELSLQSGFIEALNNENINYLIRNTDFNFDGDRNTFDELLIYYSHGQVSEKITKLTLNHLIEAKKIDIHSFDYLPEAHKEKAIALYDHANNV